jgi:adenine-specific DNA-methyltransferase
MQTPVIGDFLTAEINQQFPTIIGNPPFVKRKGKANLYIEFVAKCFDLLTPTGELLFIVPSDFLKLTSASSLITRMASAGAFTDFLFPHDEALFAGAAIDVVVFRYQKGLAQALAIVNDEPKRVICNRGILTFASVSASEGATTATIQDRFDVYVGIVSGRDHIYKQSFGNAEILTDKDKTERFILPRIWPLAATEAESTAHLLANKTELMGRAIRKFNEDNWWQWGALRNLTSVEAKIGVPCIYVRNMTRHDEVAFVGTVQLFGGTLLCLIPKIPNLDLVQIAAAINQKRDDYLYSGRFKIGQKQLCCLTI